MRYVFANFIVTPCIKDCVMRDASWEKLDVLRNLWSEYMILTELRCRWQIP